MPGRKLILDIENTLYEVGRDRLTTISGIRGIPGDKMIVSDFDGAVPQVAAVEAAPKFAAAVLEKRLRENGEIESGGRVIILAHRRKGDQLTEVLYLATPGKLPVEQDAEREHGESACLMFAVQKLLANALASLKATQPVAVLMMHDRHVDAVVGDSRNLYGAFRVSAYRSDSDKDLLAANLENALGGIEHETNIRITKIHCLHLVVQHRDDDRWVQALADSRGIPFRGARLHEVRIDGGTAFTSVQRQLRELRPADSCSPSAVIGNYRLDRLLPAAAAVLIAGCVATLATIVDREYRAITLQNEVRSLEQAIDARFADDVSNVPDFRPQLTTALQLDYARKAPSLPAVFSRVTEAAVGQATLLDEIVIEYRPEKIVVSLKGSTEKSPEADSMAYYTRFISRMRESGFALTESGLDTDTRRIRFKMRLDLTLGERRT